MRRRFMSNNKSFDYSQYMTIEVLENGVTITMPRDVEYNMGNGWVVLEAGVASPTLAEGQLISFRSHLLSGEFGTISISGYCFLRGNCMSLIGKNTLHSRVFDALFYECPIVGVEETFLPATTLADFCYSHMFRGCTSLLTAPELPATNLAISCYNSMFFGCTSLLTAPELPATTLDPVCYSDMFRGCTSLTTAPELPATTLVDNCYNNMFRGCTKLNYIKMLATDISVRSCLYAWVYGVASSGTFVKNPEATWEKYGTDGIPNGWKVVMDGEDSEQISVTVEFNNFYPDLVYYLENKYGFGYGGKSSPIAIEEDIWIGESFEGKVGVGKVKYLYIDNSPATVGILLYLDDFRNTYYCVALNNNRDNMGFGRASDYLWD